MFPCSLIPAFSQREKEQEKKAFGDPKSPLARWERGFSGEGKRGSQLRVLRPQQKPKAIKKVPSPAGRGDLEEREKEASQPQGYCVN
jgi:hypothetical protein